MQNNTGNQLAQPGRSFPLPGTNLHNLITDQEYKKNFHARLKTGNRFMALFYRMRLLPLFGMGNQIMLVSTRGRKSNQRRDTPIGYFRVDDTIHVFSGWAKGANWYKNMIACPEDVHLQVGFKRFKARYEIVEDFAERERIYERFVIQQPKGAHLLMGWDPQVDRPESADFSMMVEKVLVVRFYPVG